MGIPEASQIFQLTFEPPGTGSLSSERLGQVYLDSQSLRTDIASLSRLPFDSFYGHYSRGTWRSISILNRDGDSSNGEAYEFEGRGRWTSHAAELPYVKRLIEAEFYCEELKSARIFYTENGGMIVPHRDYLEFKNGFTRIHLPLLTNQLSISTEEEFAFHMCQGEIWYLNASRTHAAANYSTERRYHLVLDFPHNINPKSALVNLRPPSNPIYFIRRKSLPSSFPDVLAHFGASMISSSSVLRAFYLLCDYHFLCESNADNVYDWLLTAAESSHSGVNILTAKDIRKQFLGC
jgi:L-proline cis-4-hydroxylase